VLQDCHICILFDNILMLYLSLLLKTDIELLKEIYNETIPDYMNPGLDLFGKNRFDIA
jgi:uncharacterized protein (DUF608 family)